MALNLFTIPPGVPFLDALAAGWLRERGDDPLNISDGLILVPTRRAARSHSWSCASCGWALC